MRAVVVRTPGGPDALTLTEVPDPSAVGDQILVTVDAAGVNPVDLGNRMDNGWADVETPYVVGYEFAGSVADLNGCETDLQVGEPVWGLLPVRGTRWGAYAEQVAVDVSTVARRPAHLDAVTAAVLPLAGCTALQVLDRLDLQPGSWLLVHGGGGGVGHLLVQLAAARGIRVVAVSGTADRERMVVLGAEMWVDRAATPSPAAGAARKLGHPVDAAVDLVGGQLEAVQQHVRPGGSLATIVDLQGDFTDAVDRNLDIHGVLVRPSQHVLASLALAVDHGLRPTVRGVFPLTDARTAHERLEAGGVGGKLALTTS